MLWQAWACLQAKRCFQPQRLHCLLHGGCWALVGAPQSPRLPCQRAAAEGLLRRRLQRSSLSGAELAGEGKAGALPVAAKQLQHTEQ